jgi:hypothetical protein
MFLGSLAIQAAWILAVPPFGGIDEFDHAYRAASVAGGAWLPSGETTAHGRGEVLTVPERLVVDANPQCSDLRYTGWDNCNPIESVGSDRVTVLSTASRYQPLYYWAIGEFGGFSEGAGSLYLMRVATALACSALLAITAWIVAISFSSIWPRLGFVAALTPVMVYSSVVVAPNAIEMYAAVGVWLTLLGVARASSHRVAGLICLLPVFTVPLVIIRPLGPLFLFCILATWLIYVGWRGLWLPLNTHRAASAWAVGATLVAILVGLAWTTGPGAVELEPRGHSIPTLPGTLRAMLLWTPQSVAAFPFPNQQAPTVIYVIGFSTLATLLVAGIARSVGRLRWAILVGLTIAIALPFTIQLAAFSTSGPFWQGRYGWALSAGPLLLSALALEIRPPKEAAWHRSVAMLVAALLVVEHAASTTSVLLQERRLSPLTDDPRWISSEPWAIALLTAAGVLMWAWGAFPTLHSPTETDLLATQAPRIDEATLGSHREP